MYSFLKIDSGAGGNLILGTLLFLMVLVLNLKAHYEKVSPTWRLLLAGTMIVALAIPFFGGIQLRDEITSKSLAVQQAYTVEKEGDLIRFKLLISNEALKDKVTVCVISETKDKYQVEYKGSYYSIDKADVQKGN